MDQGIRKSEESSRKSNENLMIFWETMKEREMKFRELESKINKTEKAVITQRAKNENLIVEEERQTRDIFEKYQIDLRDIIGEHLGYRREDFKDFCGLSSMFTMETEQGPKTIEKRPYEFVRKYGKEIPEAQEKLRKYKQEYLKLGDINWQAVKDYEKQKIKWDFLKSQENELNQSLEDLEKAIIHIDERSKKKFKSAFDEVNANFGKVFPIIFGGGHAHLEIEGDIDAPEFGINIIARPPGKKLQNINLMSGGEKALTAVGLIFAIFLVRPSPFCLLDEVDAPLDDANVGRFNDLLKEMGRECQFILVTHNKKTMESNNVLYGVTMQEPGISKAVSVQLQ